VSGKVGASVSQTESGFSVFGLFSLGFCTK